MRHNQSRRSRGRSSRKGPNPLTRSYESNGPDVKVRGTAAHVAEKYMTLARDAQSSGDPISAENYLQHAEHYNRIVMAAQVQYQQSQPQFREGSDDNYDDDRQMNGRPRDRFDTNRFDSNGDGRGEDEGEERFDGANGDDDRGYRPQARPNDQEQRSRSGGRNDRNDRYERRDRSDNRDGGRPQERYASGEEPQPELPDQPVEVTPVEMAPPAAEAAPAPARRKRGRPARGSEPEQKPAQDGDDATPDGAAALAAFPE